MQKKPGRTFLFSLSLPIPPSANHSFGINIKAKRGRRIYLTKKARDFMDLVRKKAFFSFPSNLLEERVKEDEWIVVEFFHFDKGTVHAGDLSNRHKLVLNGLAQALGIDDYYFLVRDMSREVDPEHEGISVLVWKEKKEVVRKRRNK